MLKRMFSFLAIMFLWSAVAFAGYPEKTITLIVPFGAGGATDIPARVLANMMEKKLGQTIVVRLHSYLRSVSPASCSACPL